MTNSTTPQFDLETRVDAFELVIRDLISTLSPEQFEKFEIINSATIKAFRESPNLNSTQAAQVEKIAAKAESMRSHIRD